MNTHHSPKGTDPIFDWSHFSIAAIISFAVIAVSFFIFLFAFRIVMENPAALSLVVSQWMFFFSLLVGVLYYRNETGLPLVPQWFFCKNSRIYVISAAVVIAVYFLHYTLFPHDEIWMDRVFSGNWYDLGLSVFTAIFIAPLNEEILFRGVILHFLLKLGKKLDIDKEGEKYPVVDTLAVLISSFSFSFLHLSQYEMHTIVYIFILGAFFGYLRLKTDSLSVPIFAHFIATFVGLTIFLFF